MAEAPERIFARPVGATSDWTKAEYGPWSMDNAYGLSIEYIHADKVAALLEAAEALDRAVSEVTRYGAQTGSQWTRLSIASLKFRAAIAAFKGDAQ